MMDYVEYSMRATDGAGAEGAMRWRDIETGVAQCVRPVGDVMGEMVVVG
jgi:hypothetical protein